MLSELLVAAALAAGDRHHLSVRAYGYAWHFEDQTGWADVMPLKTDAAGRGVLMPGAVVAWDRPGPWSWTSAFRLHGAAYADCALQPAGQVAAMLLVPELSSPNVTFTAGFGLGAMVRRSWFRYVTPGEPGGLARQLGPVELIGGPYGELELRAHPRSRAWEVVLTVMPGWPATVTSTGLRLPL